MILYPSKTRENPSSLLLLYIVCLETSKSAAICVQLLNSLRKDNGFSEGMTYLGLSGRAWRRFHLRSVWVAVNNRQLNNKTINCPQIFSQRFKFLYLRIRKPTSLVHVAHNVSNMPQSTQDPICIKFCSALVGANVVDLLFHHSQHRHDGADKLDQVIICIRSGTWEKKP